jgi:hypothetical protein
VHFTGGEKGISQLACDLGATGSVRRHLEWHWSVEVQAGPLPFVEAHRPAVDRCRSIIEQAAHGDQLLAQLAHLQRAQCHQASRE